jgi:hypothetical protein
VLGGGELKLVQEWGLELVFELESMRCWCWICFGMGAGAGVFVGDSAFVSCRVG